MSRYNTSTNHPLTPNANEYLLEERVVSIHSEDRDAVKWPNPAFFEIELPNEFMNVNSVKLGNYTIPVNFNAFSVSRGNVSFTFRITAPYNPALYLKPLPAPKPANYLLMEAIYNFLQSTITNEYIVTITEGFYLPSQLATELTNRMNSLLTKLITNNLASLSSVLLAEFIKQGGYTQFIVVYNQVTQSLFFGNNCDNFTLTNDSPFYQIQNKELYGMPTCTGSAPLPSYLNWGLPANLGFTHAPVAGTETLPSDCRFYYGDAVVPGDNGFWLQPDQYHQNTQVFSIQAPNKINILGDAYIYMEIAGMNNIDETIPFAYNVFTASTNQSSGVHNAAFAKLGMIATPISQIFDTNNNATKIYWPPAERIRRIQVKMRYHSGQLVEFGTFNWSFNLLFSVLTPQTLRSQLVYTPAGSLGVLPGTNLK
jgi:hypothetical protein